MTLEVGTILRFRLRANPTKRLSTPIVSEAKRAVGKRVELQGEEAQLDWLRRKAELCGFRLSAITGHASVPNVRVIPEPKLIGNQHRRTEPGAGRLTFGSVLFDGILQISDLAKFQAALEQGIGAGKAYGFGLLSVAGVGR
jgi:CRISPR system Cascade subunit CasE